ncbi:ATP-binding cassette domain-containing protein [Nonomuraea recticatena]
MVSATWPARRACTTAAAVPERVTELLQLVVRAPSTPRGGQRQRVSIARALAAEPDVLVCDEITSALDGDTAQAMMELLTRLRETREMAVVFASHDLRLVERYADSVALIGGQEERAPAPGERP